MSRLRNSNRRRKEANSEGEQHEAAECIDRDVYRTDHLKIAELITVSGSQRACSLKGPQSAWHGTNVTGVTLWYDQTLMPHIASDE